MIIPKHLKSGDKVALIAPSSPITEPAQLENAIAYVKSLGLEPILGKSCTSEDGHMAGSDEVRAGDINWAFADDTIAGIFCLRGGNATSKTFHAVDFSIITRNPKFFCGYSDITALHAAINRLGIATFHMPMVCSVDMANKDEYTWGLLEKFVMNPLESGEISLPQGHSTKTIQGGIAEGIMCGGNLSCMTALMGTPYEINTRGKIFFMEEVGTNPPRCDRMLNGLRLAGKFDECVGVVFGDFTNCNPIDPAFSLTIPEILHNLNLKVPSVYDFPCGHILPTASMPFGVPLRLDADNCTLHIM